METKETYRVPIEAVLRCISATNRMQIYLLKFAPLRQVNCSEGIVIDVIPAGVLSYAQALLGEHTLVAPLEAIAI